MDSEADVRIYGNRDLPEGTPERPLVTFALFAYKQERYIREAVEGAFSQTYEPLEIILSDDCSTDRTFEIMQEMAAAYEGPHRVRVRRSTENRGLATHINDVARLVSGDIVVVAAGDDISVPERTQLIIDEFTRCLSTGAIFSDFSTIPVGGDDTPYGIRGETISLPEILIAGGGVQIGATYAYRRNCFTWPMPLPEWIRSEDRILPLRAALLGGVRYLPRQLVCYRLRDVEAQAVVERERIHGYNDPRHFSLISDHIEASAVDGATTAMEKLFYKLIISVVRVEYRLRRSRNLFRRSISPILFLFLRMIRKASVLRASKKFALVSSSGSSTRR